MDLTPYLKLMLEKKGEELIAVVGTPTIIRIGGQNKPVGKAKLTPEMTKAAAFSLMSGDQRKLFAKDKKLSFELEKDIGNFNVDVSVDKKAVKVVVNPATEAAKPAEEEKKVEEKSEDEGELLDSTDLLEYLRVMISRDGSDLFLTVGSQIKAKISGTAVPLSTFVADPEITKKCAYGIMTDEQIQQFEQTKDLDFAIAMPDNSGRFRVNAFFQRKTIGMVLRLIPSVIPTASDLGLPEVLLDLIMAKRGLLLMVGGTGSGKSTTLAAMLDHRNANSPGHILTIEDPVEFSHPNKMSIVNQREVGIDTASYASAIKASLREAPDVILIGEIRTEETMEAALELANTGHLCISTMHANNANQAMDRCINMFPTEKHKQLFMDMSANINAVVSQRLIPDVRGKRCAAIEVMVNTPHIASLVLKGKLNEIKDGMLASGAKGMKTFDHALYDLYKAGRISLEEALKNADSRNDLENKINFG